MSNALSEGRYPRQPNVATVLTTCGEDFRKFKEGNGTILIEHLSTLIKDLEKKGITPDIYKTQKENLEEIGKLIIKGQEKIAFTHFTRTFPHCMPHRSRF
jgi:hypothetical protein